MATLFWRDMIFLASALNLVAMVASLLALGFKAGAVAATMIFLSPAPYNLFLFACVWRNAAALPPGAAGGYRFGALAWLVAATLL